MFLDEKSMYKNPEHNYIIFVGLYLYMSAPIGQMLLFIVDSVTEFRGERGSDQPLPSCLGNVTLER